MKYLILALLAAFSIAALADSINLNSSRSNPPTAADRLGRPVTDPAVQPAEATMVKGSKSNSSYRVGVPSKDQPGQPDEAVTVKGSKSNSDYRTANPVGQVEAQDSQRLQDHDRQLRALTMGRENVKANEQDDQRLKHLDSRATRIDKPMTQQQMTTRNPTVTQGLKVSREMAPDTNVGPAASPKAPVPKVDAIKLNSSRSNIYREKAPDVTPGATPGKEPSDAEPEKPFKF